MELKLPNNIIPKSFGKLSYSMQFTKKKAKFKSNSNFISPYNLHSTIKLHPLAPTKASTQSKLKASSISLNSSYQDVIASTKSLLSQAFKSANIPAKFLSIYEEIISSTSSRNANAFILKEIKDLESNTSLLKSCLQTIQSWEESLGTIKEMCSYLRESKNWVRIKEVVKQAADTLSAHSMLALHMAETVKSWKDYVKSSLIEPDRIVKLKYHDNDIFDDLRCSCDFLADSALSVLFPVSTPDPFLISITREIPRSKIQISKQNKNFVPLLIEKNKAYLLMQKEFIERLKKVSYELWKADTQVFPLAVAHEVLPSLAERKPNRAEDMSGFYKLCVERLVKESQISALSAVISETITELFVSSIHTSLMKFFFDMVPSIAKEALEEFHEEVSSQNSKKLVTSGLIESILRNLIEAEIAVLDPEAFCKDILKEVIEEKTRAAQNPKLKRRLTVIFKRFEEGDIVDVCYNQLIEEFINKEWVEALAITAFGVTRRQTQLASLIIKAPKDEVIEDYVHKIFTPGVHSPNEIRSSAEKSPETIQFGDDSEGSLSSDYEH